MILYLCSQSAEGLGDDLDLGQVEWETLASLPSLYLPLVSIGVLSLGHAAKRKQHTFPCSGGKRVWRRSQNKCPELFQFCQGLHLAAQ